jgi:hypothetical protein
MSNPGLFKDLGKRASDLLTKDFPIDEKKVEWKTTTTNGVTIETNFNQKGDGPVVGTITPSYKLKEYGTNFLAEINTKKDVKLETSVENQVVDGLKVTLTGEAKGKENYVTVSSEYKHPRATLTASFDFGKQAGQTLKATSVVGHNSFLLGFSAEYFMGQTSEVKNFNTTLAYRSKEFEATLFGRTAGDKNEIGGSYQHSVNSDTSVAAEVVFDTSTPDSKPKLGLAGQHKLNDDVTVKGKFDTNGVLCLSSALSLNRNSKLTLAGKVDTRNNNQFTFGFGLNFTS